MVLQPRELVLAKVSYCTFGTSNYQAVGILYLAISPPKKENILEKLGIRIFLDLLKSSLLNSF